MFKLTKIANVRFILLLAICAASLSLEDQHPRNWGLAEALLKWINEGTKLWNQEPRDEPQVLPEYDFIIIGAGSAGCVLANRLTERPQWKVLLLEAGRPENFVMDLPSIAPLLILSEANWDYKSEPSLTNCLGMEGQRCPYPRGKVMGGSSTINYMVFTRGNRRDYDRWEEMGNLGWGYNDVLPYFLKLENMTIPGLDASYHSKSGPVTASYAPYRTKLADAFVEAGREIGQRSGIDYNGETQTGVSYLQATLKDGTRLSASRAYLHPIKDRRNLHVKKNSLVTKVLIDTETKAAQGVEFEHEGKRYITKARQEVIVSAGAINSPQLLMLSGIGPREHLQEKGIPLIQDLKVGYNLMDHPALMGMTFLLNQSASLILDELLADGKNLINFMERHNGPLAIPSGVEALAFYDSDNPNDPDGDPDIELIFISASTSSYAPLYKSFGISQNVYDTVYKPIQGRHSWLGLPAVLKPRSRGRILLRDANPKHHPIIYYDHFQQQYDMDIMIRAIRLMQKFSETQALKKFGSTVHDIPLPGCKMFPFNSDQYWNCAAHHMVSGIWHVSGTCKMGPPSDPTSVVDNRLRVHGISGLRVVDASVMPLLPAAHTNIPTMMVAEKAADIILKELNY